MLVLCKLLKKLLFASFPSADKVTYVETVSTLIMCAFVCIGAIATIAVVTDVASLISSYYW